MTKEDLLKSYEDYDDIIDSSINIDEANSPISIYEGIFKIQNLDNEEEFEINLEGKIIYNWFPTRGAVFYCTPIATTHDIIKRINIVQSFKILVDDFVIGQGCFTKRSLSNDLYLKGEFFHEVILGDKNIHVEKIRFSIANLRAFSGELVKKITDENLYVSRNRIILEDDKYLIKIDKKHNYDTLYNSLEEKGGYNILYGGEIINKKGNIQYKDIKELSFSLNIFLSFINGRRTSIIFMKGMFKESTIWTDYSDYHIDIHKFSPSWTHRKSTDSFNSLWKNFGELWNNPNNKDFILTAIHWYIEANKNSGFVEGSIIMAQTALELIYNWLIVENKKMILGKDSENISASNKIRLILSQLNIDSNIPNKFKALQNFLDTNQNVIDAPEAIVQIRNSIVHSQEEKRKKLRDISEMAKNEALNLSIWYIELSILSILKFDGIYRNRCSEKNIEFVPWIQKQSHHATSTKN